MPQDSIVRTLASVQFPGVYLQMDGNGVIHTEGGSGVLGVGHSGGPLARFRISPPPTDGSPYVTAFESAEYESVYMSMDGTDVTQIKPYGGGKVNKQLGQGASELFIIRPHPDGNGVAIESKAFPNRYLRLSMGGEREELRPVINCQFGAGPFEKFQLKTPPANVQLRVLCYNTHLMQFSFLEVAADSKRRAGGPTPYTVFQDEARRDLTIKNVINSLADIVSLQEVWATDSEKYFVEQLVQNYPYYIYGDLRVLPTLPPLISTSGLLLFSKFPLSSRFFERFPDMTGLDDMSNKGVLGAMADIPLVGKLLICTAHTSGTADDIRFIALKSVTQPPQYMDPPTLMMGDFNTSWKKGGDNPDYKEMRKIFMFPGTKFRAASDSWIDLHGEEIKPDPYTVKMRENTLHQFFSPARDTEPDTRLDYLWLRSSILRQWSPISASVLRGDDWVYSSLNWHWAHPNRASRLPSAAALHGRLVVVSRELYSTRILSAIFDKSTSEWHHHDTRLNTQASPGIVNFQDKFHLFYQHDEGNAIFHSSSTDGEHWDDWENIGINTGGSVCPVVYEGSLYLFFVDPDGEEGGMIFYTIKVTKNEECGPGNWSVRMATGITTRLDISATVFNHILVVVSKDNGLQDESSGIMCSFLKPGSTGWEFYHPDGLETVGAPGVIAVGDRLHVYYEHNKGDAIYRAVYNWDTWEIDLNTEHEAMTEGVCPVFFDDKYWLFYPYSGAGAYYPGNTLLHTQMPQVDVDLSDHYPLLVDLETKELSASVMVNIRSTGNVLFSEEAWAGTRGQHDPIDGFKLTCLIPQVKFTYMAHIQDAGDTEWKRDSEYVGIIGDSKRIEGFAIKLEGDNASAYELTYRAHLEGIGDTDFFTAGEFCGTRLQKKAVEAMWLRLKKK
jgi:endonuclease/exonuclease/phosphatase family metal-dependent hydrolase